MKDVGNPVGTNKTCIDYLLCRRVPLLLIHRSLVGNEGEAMGNGRLYGYRIEELVRTYRNIGTTGEERSQEGLHLWNQ